MRARRPVLRALLTLSLLVLATSAGCGEPPLADRSLLTGEPCEPPCWQGLTPGESTEEQVAMFLAASNYVDGSSLWQDRTGCGQITYWKNPTAYLRNQPTSGWTSNYLCVSNGTLKVLMIYLAYDLTLEQLLDRYGTPEAFWAFSAGVPERPYVEVNLYYPERGLMCQLELPRNDVQLKPDTRVVRAWYFASTSLEELAGPGSGIPFPRREYIDDFLQDWRGYGPIELRP